MTIARLPSNWSEVRNFQKHFEWWTVLCLKIIRIVLSPYFAICYNLNVISTEYVNSTDVDQTTRYVASDLGICCMPMSLLLDLNIGIKHDFPIINIRKVPREVLKTEGEARGFQHLPRDLANVNE